MAQIQTDQINSACGEDPSTSCEWIYNRTNSVEVTDFTETYLLLPTKILLIIIATYICSKFLKFFMSTAGNKLAKKGAHKIAATDSQVTSQRAELRANTLTTVVQSVGSMILWVIAILIIINILNISLGPLFAGAGLLGIVIGFGAQTLISDFLSGFFMLFEDQFGVGDVIDAGEVTGKVEDVSLRTTTIRDVNGTLWHIRNSEIKRVANKSQIWSRAVLDIEVAYDTDIRRAEGIIQKVAEDLWKDPEFIKGQIIEPPEVWGVESLSPNGVVIRLVVKTEPSEQFTIARELRLRIKEALDKAGIELPFPQRTIWLRQDDKPLDREQRPKVEVAPIRTPHVSDEFAETNEAG